MKIQAPEGGWRYQPGVDSDTSVTGWYVMGLQSALMAGLEVPSPTLQRVSEYLDTVAIDGGSLYKYQPIRQGFSPAMTAEGLLCRQYLGWKQNDRRLAEGAEFMLEHKASTGRIATCTTGTTPPKCCITSKATTGTSGIASCGK